MLYLCIIKLSQDPEPKYYVRCNLENEILAHNSESDWIRLYEDKFNWAHRAGYTWSMSACINAITMQPSIVAVKDEAEIKERLLDLDSARVLDYRNESGGFVGVTSDKDLSEEWEKGVKPRLIHS